MSKKRYPGWAIVTRNERGCITSVEEVTTLGLLQAMTKVVEIHAQHQPTKTQLFNNRGPRGRYRGTPIAEVNTAVQAPEVVEHQEKSPMSTHNDDTPKLQQEVLHLTSADGNRTMQFSGDLQDFLQWLNKHQDCAPAFDGGTWRYGPATTDEAHQQEEQV